MAERDVEEILLLKVVQSTAARKPGPVVEAWLTDMTPAEYVSGSPETEMAP